ncbi:hypothetical protein NC652_004568 [Populus alba x Populus x berolinensis]|nr:hypothetical protein NC652_004568 [Populus alba x Populus x berolinensis]
MSKQHYFFEVRTVLSTILLTSSAM